MEKLREYFDYNPETGQLWWKKQSHKSSHSLPGTMCEHINSDGYKVVKFMGKVYKVHRVIFYLYHSYVPTCIDHINGIKTDNRVSNLRPATDSENKANIGLTANNTSGFKGVCWDGQIGLWRAQTYKNRKCYFLGRYKTKEEAALAYNEKALELHGEFAKLNEVSNGKT